MQLSTIVRSSLLSFGLWALIAPAGFSQNTPRPLPTAPSTTASPVPPAAPVPNANPFPAPDPLSFTAASPTKATVNEFLRVSWGYDPNRIWQVQAILKTPVAGISRVVVLVAEKGGAKEQTAPLSFYVLPDGKHIIANGVLPFGVKPFADYRQLLQTQATGPAKGASAKDLELVEFSDFECPHCKEEQETIQKLLTDYPTAHFVYQNFPLTEIHSEAFKAAAYGDCVAKASGNDAFFKFADAVFAAQSELTPQSSDQALKNAVTKAGGDAQKAAACAASEGAKAAVNASLALGEQVGVSGTPTLFINGRGVPLGGIPYATLRQVIDFQAKEDGVALPPHSTEPPAPTLQSLPK